MTISVWFWNDINDELKEYDFTYPLTTTTKVWRWSLTFISLNFLIQSLRNFSCFSSINSEACEIWLQPSSNFYIIIKNLFNFFFGANFTQPIAKFLGLFALLIEEMQLKFSKLWIKKLRDMKVRDHLHTFVVVVRG